MKQIASHFLLVFSDYFCNKTIKLADPHHIILGSVNTEIKSHFRLPSQIKKKDKQTKTMMCSGIFINNKLRNYCVSRRWMSVMSQGNWEILHFLAPEHTIHSQVLVELLNLLLFVEDEEQVQTFPFSRKWGLHLITATPRRRHLRVGSSNPGSDCLLYLSLWGPGWVFGCRSEDTGLQRPFDGLDLGLD